MADKPDSNSTSTADQPDVSKAPDWTDENFDAERAKRLVANLRAEIADLKSTNSTLKSEVETLRSDAGSESEKIKEANDRAAQAEKALWTERALRKHPELEEFVEFLDGDSEEAVLTKAERLAKIGGKGDKSDADNKGGDAGDQGKDPDADGGKPDADKDDDLPGKPKPDLRPGHGGDSGAPVDPEAIAKQARAARY